MQPYLNGTDLVIWAIIIFITGMFLGFFACRVHRTGRMLKDQKEMAIAEIQKIEEERMRIAADLHDEIGPVLSSLKLVFNNIQTTTEDLVSVAKCTRGIDELLIRIREICNNLMPAILLQRGVVSAIKEFVSNVSEKTGLLIHFRYEAIPPLSSETSIHLYRITNEIIHNTIKHANATTLLVSLKAMNGLLVLSTSDDGIGFDILRNGKQGLGLMSVQRRVEIMDGDITIESKMGVGTKYFIKIPIGESNK